MTRLAIHTLAAIEAATPSAPRDRGLTPIEIWRRHGMGAPATVCEALLALTRQGRVVADGPANYRRYRRPLHTMETPDDLSAS